jgi:hypothetical protein
VRLGGPLPNYKALTGASSRRDRLPREPERWPFDPVEEIPQPIVTGPNRILISVKENARRNPSRCAAAHHKSGSW